MKNKILDKIYKYSNEIIIVILLVTIFDKPISKLSIILVLITIICICVRDIFIDKNKKETQKSDINISGSIELTDEEVMELLSKFEKILIEEKENNK